MADLLIQPGLPRGQLACCHQVTDGQKQQRDRSQPLLAVDDVVLDFAPVGHHRGDDAPEKVAGAANSNHFLEILVKLAAVFQLPVVFPLVDRDDVSLSRALHKSGHFRL